MTSKQIGTWVASATGALVLGGMVLWGVPYYIKAQVAAQFAAEVRAQPADPHPVSEQEFATTAAGLSAVLTRLDGIEARMIARDALFMEYLERQTNRRAGL